MAKTSLESGQSLEASELFQLLTLTLGTGQYGSFRGQVNFIYWFFAWAFRMR
jgi:hypothetical protein